MVAETCKLTRISSTTEQNTNHENAEMISTNEVRIPVNHTESADINPKYAEEMSRLADTTEQPTITTETTNGQIDTTTDASVDLNLSNVYSVLCVWC